MAAPAPDSWSGSVLPGGASTYYRIHRLKQDSALTREALDALLTRENNGDALSARDVDAIMATFTSSADGKADAVNLVGGPRAPRVAADAERERARLALAELGARDDGLSAEEKASLEQRGYVMLRQVISPELVEACLQRTAELLEREGAAAGRELHQEAGAPRLSGLDRKGAEFLEVHFQPRLLAAADFVLDGDVAVGGMNYRDVAGAGAGHQALPQDSAVAQAPHTRHDWFALGCVLLLDDCGKPSAPPPSCI